MKALTLVLLVLALGAGALYFVLDSESGRRAPGERASPPAAAAAEPARSAMATEPPASAPPEPGSSSQRQSVQAAAAPELRLILEGAVIAEGAPIPGAGLTLLRHETELAEAQTDGRGHFRIESAPLTSAGTLRVVARGFVPTERNLAAKPAGGTVMLGNLRLLRGQRLTGRVVDERNTGIADAELRAEPASPGGDLLVARGRSGPDGRFEIADAPPGAVIVSAQAKGFGEQSVEHANPADPLVIQLQPGMDLVILVHTPRGQPVAGAEVVLQAAGDPRASKRVGETDAEGRVKFQGLGAPVWSARATHPDYRAGNGQVQATGAEQAIECVPWPAIEGRVVAPGGAAPPPGTRVLALPASAPGERAVQLEGGKEVAPDGSFRLSGLRAGDWRVRVAAPGFAPASSGPVKLGIEGDGYAGAIELQAGARLELLLAIDAKPVPGAEVELFPTRPTPAQLWSLAGARGSNQGRRIQSGDDGLAKLENLAPGTVWAAIYAPGCPPKCAGPFVVGSSAGPIPVEIERGGRVRGRVKNKTGAPVPHAQMRIVERGGSLGFPVTVVAEADGTYASAWLPPGHYTIEGFAAEEPSLHSSPVEFDVIAGEDRTLDLEL